MGLINWSKEEEYEETLRQYHRNRSKEYYLKNRDKMLAIAQKYRQAKREVNIFKKWSDIYTEDEIDQILKYIQNEIDICKKKNILNMRAWWSNFKSFVHNDAKINLTDAGEFFCFMDTLKFKRGYENEVICEKAKKYYFYVSNEKLIKVYGELDARNARENERVKNYYLKKKLKHTKKGKV